MEHTAESLAKKFNAPIERVRQQYLMNAKQMREMERKARATGKKQGGMTADYLAERAAHFEAKAK